MADVNDYQKEKENWKKVREILGKELYNKMILGAKKFRDSENKIFFEGG
jgi:hypothetical protein